MKKSRSKLTICSDTLRVLAGMELRGVGGGAVGALANNTGGDLNGCAKVAGADSVEVGPGCPGPAKG